MQTTITNVRSTPAQRKAWKEAAMRAQRTLSDWIRRALDRAAKKKGAR